MEINHICNDNNKCYNMNKLPDNPELQRYIYMIYMFHNKKCVSESELNELLNRIEIYNKEKEEEENRQRKLCRFSAPYNYNNGYEEIIHVCDKDERCLAVITCDGEWGDFSERCSSVIYDEFAEIYNEDILDSLSYHMYEEAAFNGNADVCIPVKKLHELAIVLQ